MLLQTQRMYPIDTINTSVLANVLNNNHHITPQGPNAKDPSVPQGLECNQCTELEHDRQRDFEGAYSNANSGLVSSLVMINLCIGICEQLQKADVCGTSGTGKHCT